MTVSSLSSEESGTPASACFDSDEQRKWHKWPKIDKSITKKKKWNSLNYILKHWICNRIYLCYMLFSAMHWVVYMCLSRLLYGSVLCGNMCRIPCSKHVCWSRTGLRRSLVVGSMLFVIEALNNAICYCNTNVRPSYFKHLHFYQLSGTVPALTEYIEQKNFYCYFFLLTNQSS